ncbi:copper amine oxidase N-terminal domain-containing protein [Paenibacillus sp. 1011MAR3C5]|uniref:copper amine oxidase N-terminal domain-containing protein n=1 Tax=Paenibacillus sp. 1011MAR3C5 TaxID=1675787 RepID=UPI000E6CB5F2|nr:copper amine oxidase N-terminal domain-containing protein [Paenibacillus sp. 1011MAR3C5]RJE83626.1 copper amine oxidase N-terminal domain-containing protein [Paenibacillus sp. 1011MAR3C5]
MKKNRFLLVSLVVMLLVGIVPAGVGAATPAPKTISIKTQLINLIFDGQELKLPEGQYSFIYQGRTYVPIRYMSYALQKTVGWNAEKFMVSIDEPNEQELAELKKELLLVTSGEKKTQPTQTLAMKPVEAKLVFNGKDKTLPTGQSLFIYKGSIYVPLRFLSESVGSEITWDDKTRTVKSESAAYREEHGSEDGTPSNPGQGGNGDGGTTPGVPGGETSKQTYEQITANAESRLDALRNSCENELFDLAYKYLDADDTGKEKIKTQISQKVDSCTTKFEAIISDVTAKLEANEYSTDVIAQYRKTFEAEIEAGKKIVEKMG